MKSVLAVADGGPASEAIMLAAGYAAGLCTGQVDVMHVRDALAINETAPAAFMIEGATEAIIEEGEHTASERAARTIQIYERLAPKLPKPRYVEFAGDEAEVVIARGRVADLIVVGRPGSDPVKPEPAHVPAAIFECARPVIVVPPTWRPQALQHALIAWNGSSQAARAIGYSLPLLQQAATVTVMAPAGDDSVDSAELVEYLDRNAVKATAIEFEIGAGSARTRGKALLREVEQVGADLLVMGAYGQQGILRFLGLGGATGKVISACKVPVLLAH